MQRAVLTITGPSRKDDLRRQPAILTASYSGFVNGDTAASLTTPPTCTTTATSTSPVGTYPTTCSGAADPNYQITYAPGTLTVQPAALTITASSGSMAAGSSPDITPAYRGFVNGDTAASLTTPPTCTTTATSTSPAGTYPTTCSGAVDSNYQITYVPGTLTVGQGTLTITASSGKMTYGASPPSVTAGYSGFVNGDTAASLTTPPTCTTTAKSNSPAGTYATTCSGAVDPNYQITYAPGTLTVQPAALTITASSGTMTYGASLPPVAAGYSGFVNGDTPASLTTPPTCTTTAKSNSPAGTYPTTCSGAVDPNYQITYAPGTLTVQPAALTITASSGSMIIGTNPPAITASYRGLVNGDTPASLTTPPTCTTTAKSNSPAGPYPTTCSGAVDPNYQITYVNGTISVGKFKPCPGGATNIAVGANGSVWIIGTNAVAGGYGIYHWNGTGWTPVSGGGVTIAVDPGGNPWLINSAHQIFHWNGQGWASISGAARDIAVGRNGSVWIIGNTTVAGGYSIYNRNGTGWTPVSGGGVTIAVDPGGNPWLLNSAHQIFHWNGQGWASISGAARDIAVGANGSVWIIGNTAVAGGYSIYNRNGTGWTPVSGGGVTIAVDPSGNPWLLNSAHQIYSS